MSSFEPSLPRARDARFVPDSAPARGHRFDPADARPEAAATAAEGVASGAAPSASSADLDPEDALRRAFEEGRAAGRDELPWREAEALRSSAAALGAAAEALERDRASYLAAHRHEAVELAVAIAERIAGRALHTDAAALGSLIERAAERVGGEAGPVRVRLSARDRETLAAGEGDERLVGGAPVAFETDPDLTPGDVRVEAGAARVDARLSELLRRVREALDGLEAGEGA